jgi:hypothetical protein
MAPTDIAEHGTAVKALVWYAKATKNATNRKMALQNIIDYSNALAVLQ